MSNFRGTLDPLVDNHSFYKINELIYVLLRPIVP